MNSTEEVEVLIIFAGGRAEVIRQHCATGVKNGDIDGAEAIRLEAEAELFDGIVRGLQCLTAIQRHIGEVPHA